MKYIIYLLLCFSSLYVCNAEKQWVKKHYKYQDQVKALKVIDSTKIIAIVENIGSSKIYKSYDAGNSWTNTYSHYYPAYNDSVAMISIGSYILDSLHYYICMFPQPVLDITTDGGQTFSRVEFGTISSDKNNYCLDLSMYNSMKGYLITVYNIMVTSDGWKTFTIYDKPNKFIGTSNPSFFIDSTKIATINGRGISNQFLEFNLETGEWKDYNAEIQPKEGEFPLVISGVDFITDSLGYAAGKQRVNDTTKNIHYGFIWKTMDRGRTWEIIYNELQNPRFGLSQIHFTDSLRAIAGGNGAKYMLTEDGGKTWEYVIFYDYLYAMSQDCVYCGDYPIAWFFSGGAFRYEEVTGITEGIFKEISIKPLQTTSEYYLEIEDPKSREYEIIFSDANGKHITTPQIVNTAISNSSNSIDLTRLSSGTYFYMITCNNSLISTGKFVNVR